MNKLGYLGPPGTFSHTAALAYARGGGYEPLCCSGLESIFRRIENGGLEAGVVPAENSTCGTVGETLDLLSAVEGVYITGELLLPVRQHLLARPGVKPGEIKRVYSHPQALAQCRHFLQEQLPGVPVIETVSTADAAMTVSGMVEPAAAVGSVSAADTYGLQVLWTGVQDGKDNVTRFLVLGRGKAVVNGRARTSLAMAIQDRPGALYHILREFALRKINLTRIESRPAGSKLGDYIFFIDFLGGEQEPPVQAAIAGIREFALWVRLLGSYPVYREGGETGDTELAQYCEAVDLNGIREKIDLVDGEIMRLLTIRQHLADEVARCKAGKRRIVDRQREEEVIGRVRELAEANALNPAIVENIYRLIIRGSVLRQREVVADGDGRG